MITPCLGIKPALLCHIKCDGGTSALTESAGNGMTSPGLFSVLRGHQSSLQGQSDTDHMAVTLQRAVSALTQGPLQAGHSINPCHDQFYHGKCETVKMDDILIRVMTVGDCLYSKRDGTQDLL